MGGFVALNSESRSIFFAFLVVLSICFCPVESVSRDVVECIQSNGCGVFPVCKYSLSYTKSSCFSQNCTKWTSTKEEREPSVLEGHISLMTNDLNRLVEYTWNVIGYVQEAKTDDSSARKYHLPGKSVAYFDTRIPLRHTIRLTTGGETVDAKTSTGKQCTRGEACQYLLRTCQSYLSFVDTSSMSTKASCVEVSEACGYFVHSPDLSSPYVRRKGNYEDDEGSGRPPYSDENGESSGTSYYKSYDSNENEGGGRGTSSSSSSSSKSDYIEGTITKYREGANHCISDCLWSWYPSRYLPSQSILEDLVDSLDILRRVYLGLDMNHDSADRRSTIFVDDDVNIYRTSEEEEISRMLAKKSGQAPERSSGLSGGDVFVIVMFVIFAVVCLAFIVFAIYRGQFQKSGFYAWLSRVRTAKEDGSESESTEDAI